MGEAVARQHRRHRCRQPTSRRLAYAYRSLWRKYAVCLFGGISKQRAGLRSKREGCHTRPDKDQEAIESQRFELNPAEVIRANEEFLVESCCFRVKTRDTFKFWTAKVTWTDVRCL